VLDDFERGLQHAGDAPEGTPHAQLAEGIRMTHGRLLGVLSQHGLTEIAVEGQFDPHLHEAVMMQPAPAGVVPDTVLNVVQKGYMLGDRVLRHAKVIVAGDA
jgi:molecular chaperone GrpE